MMMSSTPLYPTVVIYILIELYPQWDKGRVRWIFSSIEHSEREGEVSKNAFQHKGKPRRVGSLQVTRWTVQAPLPLSFFLFDSGQLNRENIPLSPCAPENLVSRDGFGIPVPRQPAHLHTQAQAESGAYLRDPPRVPRRRPIIYFKPPTAIGPVPSLSGHAIAYGWRSLPRVRRHRASSSQGSSERVLP